MSSLMTTLFLLPLEMEPYELPSVCSISTVADKDAPMQVSLMFGW